MEQAYQQQAAYGQPQSVAYHSQQFLQKTIGQHPVAVAVVIGVLVLILLILAFYAYGWRKEADKCSALSTKSGYSNFGGVTSSSNLLIPGNNPQAHLGSQTTGEMLRNHDPYREARWDATFKPWLHRTNAVELEHSHQRHGRREGFSNATCSSWSDEASAEANALAASNGISYPAGAEYVLDDHLSGGRTLDELTYYEHSLVGK